MDDYKEKYNQAVKKIKDLFNEGEQKGFTIITYRKDFEKIFPELCESEDERIRKALIKLVKKAGEGYENVIDGVSIENAIAWLEKQGTSYTKRDVDDAFVEGMACAKNELEKQGEKKPIEEINGEDYGIDGLWHAQRILEKTLGEVEGYQSDDGILDHKAAITAVKKLYKQKLAWSVEDMSKVQRICKYLDEAKKYYADITEVRDCMIWLKSIIDRVIPQPKQEWNKGDMEMLNAAISFVKHSSFTTIGKGKNNTVAWLKSLKDRYTWKPSKGQLECLDYAIDKAEKDYSPLANNRIYLTLKALKEELEKLKG